MTGERSSKGTLAAACGLHATLIGGAYMSLPPLFERMATVDGWSLRQLQQAWAFVPLGSMVVAMATGAVLQRRADRPLVAAAGLVTILAILLRLVVRDAVGFAGALFLFGVGTGAMLVALTSRVSRLFQGPNAGFAQAAFFGAYTFGTAVGLASADPLATWLGGWRSVSIVWAVLAAVALVPALGVSLPPSAPETEGQAGAGQSSAWRGRVLRYAFVYASYVGGYLGIVGLLPYQLRQWGWTPALADGVLAVATVGFVVGSFLLAWLTDHGGRRRLVFGGCMLAAAVLTVTGPSVARSGAGVIAVAAIAGVGFFSGALALFFPIVLEDPATGGTEAPRSIGLTTAASYGGGFLVPFALAPFAATRPSLVLMAYALAFAAAGLAMLELRGGSTGRGA